MSPLTRRKFLVRSVAAGAMASLLSQRMYGFPLGLPPGIQLYSVNKDIADDAAAALKQVAAIGYKEVETAGFGSLKTAAEFRKALDDSGLKCPSAHLAFDLKNLQTAFDDANALGCAYATTPVSRRILLTAPDAGTVAQGMQPITLDDVKRLGDVLNNVGSAAKKAGLKFAVHNHAFEFADVGDMTGYEYLLTHTDPALVYFELDCGWATVAKQNPVDLFQRYPGRFRMIHMSDYLPVTSAWDPATVPPGAELGGGMVPYKKILTAIAGKGIEHVFVEQAGPFARMSQMEAARTDFRFLQTVR